MLEIQHVKIPKQRCRRRTEQHPRADSRHFADGAFLFFGKQAADDEGGKREKQKKSEQSAYHDAVVWLVVSKAGKCRLKCFSDGILPHEAL